MSASSFNPPNAGGQRATLQPTSNGPAHPDPNDLVLYAMQLLSAPEADTIARHLQRCAECRGELARVQGDLATYAHTVDLEAPAASARKRLLEQIGREKKIVPIAEAGARPQTDAQAPAVALGRSGSIFSMEEAKPKRVRAAVVLGWAGWAVAAGLAFTSGYLVKQRQNLRDNVELANGEIARLNADAATSHRLMDALTDPHAVRVTLTAKNATHPGPIGGVTYNADKGTLVFLASELDPLQTYKTYELWVIPQSGTPVPAGTFHPDDQGNASVILPDLAKGVAAKAFGVTIEDEGGSQTPTLPIIMAGS